MKIKWQKTGEKYIKDKRWLLKVWKTKQIADHQYDPTSGFRPFIRNILKNDVGRPAAIPSLDPLGMTTTAVNEKDEN